MNYVFVKFSGTEKNYVYKTKLNLIEGATYKIVADGITTYASPVKVCSVVPTRPNFGGVIREITTAENHYCASSSQDECKICHQ